LELKHNTRNPDFPKVAKFCESAYIIHERRDFPPLVFIARQKPYDQYLIIHEAGQGEMFYTRRLKRFENGSVCGVWCGVRLIRKRKRA
jgi:hypothetical protein